VNQAWSAVCIGRYAEAESLLRAGAQLADGSNGSYLGCAREGTALLHDYAVGNWDGLATRADDLIRTASDVPSVVTEARLVLGRLALATGELREAEAQLAEATGSVPIAVAADGELARLAAATGAPTTAQQRIRHGLAMVRDKGVWVWSAELVPAAVAVLARMPEHQPVARKLLDELAAGLAGRDAPLASAALLAGRALLAEADCEYLAAAAQHREAAWAYAVLPYPYAAAQAIEARGRCLLAAGQDGTTAVTEAATVYERLGATWDVARCRHLLRSLGRTLPHRRGRRGYGGQLSPREQEVVRLVRTGLTNREVAEALFLSPRTVEAHVARALRKLGLRSRRALAGSHS
jgi:DNA-binding CsgD family transcriptional regulator